ncbi:MAG: M20/M25/M40 family metallo-hydrolase, partial [bacterium]|nr:M20/M25/M40 family metallo-hydrolase [bacterium]
RAIGDKLDRCGFEVEYLEAADRPEHSPQYPRMNVLGRKRGHSDHPLIHLNGHTDVVPAGEGWTVDPFGGLVRDGRLCGRGSADMKAGIAAAVYAAEAVRRTGVQLEGSIEVSGTVDEESGGFAGMAWLAETGRIAARRTDYVIIPEPLNVDRICIGHRGVYWFKVKAHGKAAHGSMPFLGVSAIDQMSALLEVMRNHLSPALAERTTRMPV